MRVMNYYSDDNPDNLKLSQSQSSPNHRNLVKDPSKSDSKCLMINLTN